MPPHIVRLASPDLLPLVLQQLLHLPVLQPLFPRVLDELFGLIFLAGGEPFLGGFEGGMFRP